MSAAVQELVDALATVQAGMRELHEKIDTKAATPSELKWLADAIATTGKLDPDAIYKAAARGSDEAVRKSLADFQQVVVMDAAERANLCKNAARDLRRSVFGFQWTFWATFIAAFFLVGLTAGVIGGVWVFPAELTATPAGCHIAHGQYVPEVLGKQPAGCWIH